LILSDQERLIDARISILQLALELKHVQQLCTTAGMAWSGLHQTEEDYEPVGREGFGPRPDAVPGGPATSRKTGF